LIFSTFLFVTTPRKLDLEMWCDFLWWMWILSYNLLADQGAIGGKFEIFPFGL
jgi:hypothetical protein